MCNTWCCARIIEVSIRVVNKNGEKRQSFEMKGKEKIVSFYRMSTTMRRKKSSS